MRSTFPRTRRALSHDDLARLRAAYDDRSIPLQQVAADFAIPVSTLLRWVAEMDWPRRSRGAALPAPSPTPAAPTQVEAPAVPARAPQLLSTLQQVSALARRELADLAAHRARSLEERERVARLVASLTRSLERVGESIRREKERRSDRAFDRRWARERAAG